MIFVEREKLVFEMLEKIKGTDFVLIGGYAVNAFTLPRFSLDCDLVVRNKKDAEKIALILKKNGFRERKEAKKAYGKFKSLEFKEKPKTTFDILWSEVLDRQSQKKVGVKKIFTHSAQRTVLGKGSPIKIECRVIDPEMLAVMKMVSARKADIRDVFMLHSANLDHNKLLKLLKEIKPPKESLIKIKKTIKSKQFRDSLAGVYGKIQEKEFESTKKKTLSTIKLYSSD